MNAEFAVKALAGLRIVIGVAARLAPRLAAGRAGHLPPVAAGLVFAPAIAAVALGLAALGGADTAPE